MIYVALLLERRAAFGTFPILPIQKLDDLLRGVRPLGRLSPRSAIAYVRPDFLRVGLSPRDRYFDAPLGVFQIPAARILRLPIRILCDPTFAVVWISREKVFLDTSADCLPALRDHPFSIAEVHANDARAT